MFHFGNMVLMPQISMGFITFVAEIILTGFAFYKLAKIRDINYPWLAFIPLFNLYMIGIIGDSLKYTNYKVNKYFENVPLAFLLPLGVLVGNVFTIGLVPLLFSIFVALACIMIMYLIFDFYDEQNKVLFTILSVIPVVGPCLILYSTRNIKI